MLIPMDPPSSGNAYLVVNPLAACHVQHMRKPSKTGMSASWIKVCPIGPKRVSAPARTVEPQSVRKLKSWPSAGSLLVILLLLAMLPFTAKAQFSFTTQN
ncbi:MAG TPA: hypothetical protein VLA12_00680, partial [Planctomycetaceae bacterium]|nr:hypothetical protein [Planctomycetaceae bacterium]